LKILFINPPYTTTLKGIKESAGHMMPLSFGYLAAYARERMTSLEFKILDAEAMQCNLRDIESAIIKIDPDVVAITTPTPTIPYVYQILKIAKQHNSHVCTVLGGIHATVMPGRTMRECREVDFIVVGEGEETFYQLLLAVKENSEQFEEIDGLWYKRKGQIFHTNKRKFISDLDTIPFPARDFYDMELYRPAPTKKVSDESATPILTSRGCPYNCIHCPSRTIWKGEVRFRSAEDVVQEIELCVHTYGLREINFFDDTFTINRKRVIDICNKIIERQLDIFWVCLARTNFIDEELVQIMKDAGCRKISFGFESGDQNILNLMRKKTTVDLGRKAVNAVRGSGVLVHGSFMLGNVGETEDTIKKTIQFANSLDLDNATFFITTPYPGTDLYKIARSIGSLSDDTPWEDFAPLSNAVPILVQNNLSADQLFYWQKKAFKKFYLNPKYILKKLKNHMTLGGIKTLIEGFKIFIRIVMKRK